jgi:hypothetical protein
MPGIVTQKLALHPDRQRLPRSSEADAAVDGCLTCRYAAQIPVLPVFSGHMWLLR